MLSEWGAIGGIPLVAVCAGYLLGSVPFGLVLTRVAGLGDVRKIGSGNIGATNVLRTGNKFLAALTLAADLLKGTAAVLIGNEWGLVGAVAAGAAAFVGHLFPVWLSFKGGKGVATYIGVLLGLSAAACLVFCATWLVIAFLTRYSSLSALVASLAAPLYLGVMGEQTLLPVICIMTVMLIAKHHANISRLLSGKETKIGAV